MAKHPKVIVENGRENASQILEDCDGPHSGTDFVDKLGTPLVGALGELAAARIVKARIVSHRYDHFDLRRLHPRRPDKIDFEVKASFTQQDSPNLAGKVFDRYCEVKLQVRVVKDRKEIWAVECFTRNQGKKGKSLDKVLRSFRPFRVFVA